MNYRHAFHAGNFADVVKHSVLVALLEALKSKQTPLSYFESHAGSGRYNLGAPEAQKTGEYLQGVARLLAKSKLPSSLHVYLNLVRSMNEGTQGHLLTYPGSPLIASLLLRENDRLQLCELQDSESAQLKLEFAGDARVAVHQRDGYQALKALLPPTPRRGMALIDPPFEAQDEEFEVIADALEPAFKRWTTGVYVIWYPIKVRQRVTPFHRFLRGSGMKKVLIAELCLHPDNSMLRLNGCGMAIVNAPYKFDRVLSELMPVLLSHLAQSRFGTQNVQWLVGE